MATLAHDADPDHHLACAAERTAGMRRRYQLAAVPRPARRWHIHLHGPAAALDRAVRRFGDKMEDANSWPRLVVAGHLGRADLANDCHRRWPRVVRCLRRAR